MVVFADEISTGLDRCVLVPCYKQSPRAEAPDSWRWN